jgi:hypothetical protein
VGINDNESWEIALCVTGLVFHEAGLPQSQNWLHSHDRPAPVAMVLGHNVITFAGRTERHRAADGHARDADFVPAFAA